MFNTFNLFNFFQQPNTGKVPNPGTFQSLDLNDQIRIVSGKVADFNWTFPYIDRSISKLIFLSSFEEGGQTYEIRLISEYIDDFITGIRRPIISNNISGKFYKDSNFSILNFNIEGNIFGNPKDLTEENINISGILKKSSSDFTPSKILISGSIFNPNNDFCNSNQKISGSIVDASPDLNFSSFNISGILKKYEFDKTINNLAISGKLFPIKKDSTDIEYYITGYLVKKNAPIYEIEKIDEITNLNYYINRYIAGSSFN